MSKPTPLWRVVAEREVSTQLRSRGFQVSTALLLVGLIAGVVLSTVLGGRATTEKIGVVDEAGSAAVAAGSAIAGEVSDGTELEAETYDDRAAAERAVRDGDVAAALLPAADGGGEGDGGAGPGTYQLVGDDSVDATVSQALTAAWTSLATERNASAQDVDLQALAAGTQLDRQLLDPDADDAALRQVASLVFVLLFFITALTFGLMIATNVAQEKESRVVEILAAAVPIRSLLWGKIIGASVLAIGQTVLLAVAGVIGLAVSGQTEALTVLGPAIIWYVAFFVLGFVALAGVWSVAGSLAGRQQDLQTTATPVQMLLFLPYIVAFTAGEGVRTVVSMLPIVSTMLMPARLAEGDVPVWQLVVAIVATVVAAVLLVRLSARIYERTLLRTGGKISFTEALRSAREPADR